MEEQDKLKIFKDAGAISKLSKKPVKVEMPVFEVSDEQEAVVKDTVPAFLHSLGWLERNHVRASYAEAFKFWVAQGGELESARDAVSYVIPRMTVYFSLKVSDSPKAERFFKTQDEVLAYPFDQTILDLYGKYVEEFMLTEKEWGNWQRARSLGISSALPDTSEESRSGEKSLN